MKRCADLELGLHRYDAEQFVIEFRFSLPDEDTDVRLTQAQPALAKFDLEALKGAQLDPVAYGKTLTDSLFADGNVKAAFAKARAATETRDYGLRIRLLVGPTAPELHALRWETLRDPDNADAPLFTNDNILVSRYLSSMDLRPLRLRPQANLRALVIVANPGGLDKFQLAPIDVALEVKRAKDGLGAIPVTELVTTDTVPVTIDSIGDALRDVQGHDIVYIVAHGSLLRGEPILWLQDKEGKAARVNGNDFVVRLRELPTPPRLVMLVSCQSASASEEGTLSALGPRVSESGVPAVIAMQGNFTMDTANQFLPKFFEELQKDGQIDRAMTVARGVVRGRPDFWMPVLFMRLKTGRIWYVPGFGEDRKSFEKWPTLLRSIKLGKCTPILGFGLVEPLFGSSREIARRWAEDYHYPLQPHEREDLPQVAQYLNTNQSPVFLRDELGQSLRREAIRRYTADLPPELQDLQASLDSMVETIGAKRRGRDALEVHKVLAGLPFPIFITANPDNQLANALKEAGKDPQVVICPWNEYAEQMDSIYQKEPGYTPSKDRPLVYHLFGRLSEPDTLVLTEDDYFDFLMGVTSNKDLIPSGVRRALADSALLFLGFHLDEWDFRIMYRSIMGQEGRGRRSRYAHIAGQVEPEEGRIIEPDRARRYLEDYFQGADISLFWGSTDDFVKELSDQWAKAR